MTNLRTDGAYTAAQAALRFNGDAGNSYLQQQIFASGATVSGQEVGPVAQCPLLSCSGASAPAGGSSAGLVLIPNYIGAFAKQMFGLDARRHGGSPPYQGITFSGGQWFSTAAINRVFVMPSTAVNFVAGSHVTVYGLA